MNLKLLVLAVFVLVYLYNLLLALIHLRSADNPVPDNVKDVYGAGTCPKWRAYHAEKVKLEYSRPTLSRRIEAIGKAQDRL